MIVISSKTRDSSGNGANVPNAKSCSKSVARCVIDVLRSTKMMKEENLVDFPSKINELVPKLQIPLNISTWLSSESVAIQRKKKSTLFASHYSKAPKQKTIVDLYAGATSGETSMLQRRQEVCMTSKSARSAPIPPMHERTETHGARTSRFLRKNLKL
jgi:hypothetical protein